MHKATSQQSRAKRRAGGHLARCLVFIHIARASLVTMCARALHLARLPVNERAPMAMWSSGTTLTMRRQPTPLQQS